MRQRFPRKRPSRALTKDELGWAAASCFVNADALHMEAQIFAGQNCHARVYSLAYVGIEELAKAKVCLGLFDADHRMAPYAKPAKFWEFWRGTIS